jgi:hypothetical protein
LVKTDGMISPSAFHNSVQNTAAGYWSIAQQCTQPATAIAAGNDTFAMAVLEAWCQLSTQGGELLLVCYDEAWPAYLEQGCGEPAFACAFVLAAGSVDGSILQIGKPQAGTITLPAACMALMTKMPILAAIPLLELTAVAGSRAQVLGLSPRWQVEVSVC